MASVSISCPSCSATDGVVRNGKSTAGHQRYLCVGCRATARIMGVGLNTILRHLKNSGRSR
ncbi:IS1 family transposase [Klebsiella grimontii]|uniref:IS1 family transposase n=1 Tax=Klebsiella grimontii TaxID=2058152 RepID=UPI003BF80CB5